VDKGAATGGDAGYVQEDNAERAWRETAAMVSQQCMAWRRGLADDVLPV
jgi:hypothetical protein